jgi:hypothetical protein
MIRDRQGRVVFVEGERQSGKTKFSRSLGSQLAATVLSTDRFASLDPSIPYVDGIRLDELADAIECASGPLIVEGICLADTAARISLNCDVRVYLKVEALAGWNLGADLEQLEGARPTTLLGGAFDWDVREYHRRVGPHLIANQILRRLE